MFIKLRSKIINYIMIQSIRNSYKLGNISNNKVTITVKAEEGGYFTEDIDVQYITYNYIHISFKELNKIIPLNYKDNNFNHNFYSIMGKLKQQHQIYAENIFNTILQLSGFTIGIVSLIKLK